MARACAGVRSTCCGCTHHANTLGERWWSAGAALACTCACTCGASAAAVGGALRCGMCSRRGTVVGGVGAKWVQRVPAPAVSTFVSDVSWREARRTAMIALYCVCGLRLSRGSSRLTQKHAQKPYASVITLNNRHMPHRSRRGHRSYTTESEIRDGADDHRHATHRLTPAGIKRTTTCRNRRHKLTTNM